MGLVLCGRLDTGLQLSLALPVLGPKHLNGRSNSLHIRSTWAVALPIFNGSNHLRNVFEEPPVTRERLKVACGIAKTILVS